MKQRNYMFRLALSLTLAFILPIEIIVYSIFLPINYNNGNLSISDLFFNIGIMLLTIFGIFIIISFMAFIMMKLNKIDKLEYKNNKISNGLVYIKEEDIKNIKARRFLFVYYISIYEKLWFFNPSITYYFHDKNELIDYLNDNSFVLKHVNKKDLIKLGLNNKIEQID